MTPIPTWEERLSALVWAARDDEAADIPEGQGIQTGQVFRALLADLKALEQRAEEAEAEVKRLREALAGVTSRATSIRADTASRTEKSFGAVPAPCRIHRPTKEVELVRPTCDVEVTTNAIGRQRIARGERYIELGSLITKDEAQAVVRAVLSHVHPQPRETKP